MSSHPSRFAAVAFSVLLLLVFGAACVPIPVPTERTWPRYSPDQIAEVGRDVFTRDAVRTRLGPPDIRRQGDEVWIYYWTVTSGSWYAVPVLGPFAGYMGPITSDTAVLVLTFDHDGLLLTRDLAREDKGKEGRFCTEAGLCVELYRGSFDVFAGNPSAVTAIGKTRYGSPSEDARANQCLVVIWLDQTGSKGSGAGGLLISVEPGRFYSWLPPNALSELVLPPGGQTLEARAKDRQGSATFECRADEKLYLAIGAGESERNRLAIVLRRFDPVTGRALTADMARVLP